MGKYLNPGKMRFEITLQSAIYVDKTGMLAYLNSVLNTNERFLAVSRPRRFGKTTAAEMICAYYNAGLDTREMFLPYKIAREENWDRYLNAFSVIRINVLDFVTGAQSVGEALVLLKREVMVELLRQYPQVVFSAPEDLRISLEDIFDQTEDQFVFVLDEWDCVFRKLPDDRKGQKEYLDFLRDLFKDREYVALAYITGILPIKKYGQHSALNMFAEYSMLEPQQLAEYVGFTDEEVRALCARYHRSYEQIRDWYDGYDLYGIVPPGQTRALEYQIYSPYSVSRAVTTGNICNYWNATETYEALHVHINRNFDGLGDMILLLMEGGRLKINTRRYQNDMSTMSSADDILTLLIHLGYLGYDSETEEVYIPNREILDEYRRTIDGDGKWDRLYAVLHQSQKLLEATWAGDAGQVAVLLERAHQRAGNLTYHSEAALGYAIRLAYFSAEQYYTLVPEMQAGKGYADLVYLPSPRYPEKPALLVELSMKSSADAPSCHTVLGLAAPEQDRIEGTAFADSFSRACSRRHGGKYDQDADTAMSQIHRQRYPESLQQYRGNLILVGINYDREARADSAAFQHHSCVIERA